MNDVTPGSTSVLEAHIDWLTATFKPGIKATLAQAQAVRWLESRQREGFKRTDWAFQGYLGERTDGLSLGERADSSIIRLSGDTAKAHASTLLRLASNVSRLDLQVTIQSPDTDRNFATEGDGAASMDARCEAGLTRRQLIHTDPGGSTFYLGSRSSERFMRVYDKHAESEGVYPPGTWRWEVEYKGARAVNVSRHIQDYGNLSESVRSIVEQAFKDYGIVIPCDPLPRGWRDAGIRAETSDERRVSWLQRSVGPMVGRLLETMDPQTILNALGLEAYLDVVEASNGVLEAE